MSDVAQFTALNMSMASRLNAGDAPGATAHYRGDGAVLPPGAPMLQGPDAIEAAWKGALDAGLTNIQITCEECETSGKSLAVKSIT